MTNWYDLIKTISPTAGTLPTTTEPDLYDWSSLPYYGQFANAGMLPGGFDAGNTPDPETYVNALLPGQKYSELANFSFQDTFGGHSGVTQNPDGTFTAKRLVQGTTDPTKYEQNTYKLSEDGKSLVPVSDAWTPITIKDSGFWDTPLNVLQEAGPLFLAAYGLTQIAGSLAGTTAAAGTGAATGTAAFDPLSAYLTTGGVEGSIAGGAAAGGGAAGAIGGMGPLTGDLLAGAVSPAASPIYTAPINAALIESAVGTEGYGASSAGAGGGAGTLTGPTAGLLPGMSGPTVGGSTPTVPNPATAGSGALGTLGDWLMKNPMLAGALLGGITNKPSSGTRAAAPLPEGYKPLTYGTPSGIFGKYDPTAEELAAPGSQGMFANYLKRELTRGG
jgi:hypothetical protein